MGILFRQARSSDALALVPLVAELGYPSEGAALARRLERLLSDPAHVLLVAEESGVILGWIHAQEFLSLASEPAGLITGLVVDPAHRRLGVGRALLSEVETWSRARGLGVLRLRVNKRRGAAQVFYRQAGFEFAKEQLQFKKQLESPDGEPAQTPAEAVAKPQPPPFLFESLPVISSPPA
jgi:ribosomal protein S18 acetylase RimI-like enzyme